MWQLKQSLVPGNVIEVLDRDAAVNRRAQLRKLGVTAVRREAGKGQVSLDYSGAAIPRLVALEAAAFVRRLQAQHQARLARA